MTSWCAAAGAASHLHQHVAQCIQTAAARVQPNAPANIVTCILTHARTCARAHTPHGAGNMSEQSRVWHVNQSLLLEVRRDSAGEDSRRRRAPWKRFRFLCLAMKVKETCKFPKPWLVRDERLYCAALYLCVFLVFFCMFSPKAMLRLEGCCAIKGSRRPVTFLPRLCCRRQGHRERRRQPSGAFKTKQQP